MKKSLWPWLTALLFLVAFLAWMGWKIATGRTARGVLQQGIQTTIEERQAAGERSNESEKAERAREPAP